MSHRRTKLPAGVVAAGALAADQATKAIVRGSIARGERVDVLPGIDLVNTRNTGVAFSLFAGGGRLLAVIAVVALAGLLWSSSSPTSPAGHLVTHRAADRRRRRQPDRPRRRRRGDRLLDLPLWPVFNVADMAITFGMLALLYVLEGPPSRERR